MNLRDVSWRLVHLIVELMHDAPLNKKLLYVYFNDLIDLDEQGLPANLSQDLRKIKSFYSHPDAITVDKLSEPELLSLATRIVLLMSEVSYHAGLQAAGNVLTLKEAAQYACRDFLSDNSCRNEIPTK